jgi:hypothetical protein
MCPIFYYSNVLFNDSRLLQVHSDYFKKEKAEQTKGVILRQLGHLDLIRPAAFRPHLATGLALSGAIY